VGSKISELLAQAASGATGTAYDPACGIGEVLLQLWQRSSDSDRLRLAGVDVNREYVLVCRQRCFLAGAEATIECADILERDPHPDLRADVVVAEPPLGLAMPTGFSVTVPR
jgi:type I restriction-modification system DNA methylase subunit